MTKKYAVKGKNTVLTLEYDEKLTHSKQKSLTMQTIDRVHTSNVIKKQDANFKNVFIRT